LRLAAIIKHFDLCKLIYKQTVVYGHLGQADLDLPWERTNMVDKLRQAQ